jgi:hypothetical protein
MNAESGRVQVHAWTAVGAMTPEAIFARLDQSITNSYGFSGEEIAALQQNFESVCDHEGRVSEPAFTTFVLSKTSLSPALTKAVHILFDSLCYLSKVPLQSNSPPPTHLTLEGLTRALVWILPSRSGSVITSTSGYRIRTPADHRRLIFESLATSRDGGNIPFDSKSAQALAARNAFTFEPSYESLINDAGINFDEDGDEMYHDVVDVLASTQPHVSPHLAEVSRDAFRLPATGLHQGAPSLHQLSIPRLRLEAFMSLMLATHFDADALDVDEDVKSAAQCMAARFCQADSARSHAMMQSVGCPMHLIEGTTWPMFDFAVAQLLVCVVNTSQPHVFDSLYHLLGSILFDQACPQDAPTSFLPISKKGALLTLPLMAQLDSTALFQSICFGDIRRFQCYSSVTRPTTAELVKAINSIPECALLVISGRTNAGETCMFCVFIARPLVDGPCIQDGGTGFKDTAMLFQLSPIHDVFRGKLGARAWTATDEGIVFGNEGHGAALIIDNPLTHVRFTHTPTELIEDAIYLPTEGRGEFETQFTIDKVELWGEDPQ